MRSGRRGGFLFSVPAGVGHLLSLSIHARPIQVPDGFGVIQGAEALVMFNDLGEIEPAFVLCICACDPPVQQHIWTDCEVLKQCPKHPPLALKLYFFSVTCSATNGVFFAFVHPTSTLHQPRNRKTASARKSRQSDATAGNSQLRAIPVPAIIQSRISRR